MPLLPAKNTKLSLKIKRPYQNRTKTDWKCIAWVLYIDFSCSIKMPWSESHINNMKERIIFYLVSTIQASGVMVWGIFYWHILVSGILVPVAYFVLFKQPSLLLLTLLILFLQHDVHNSSQNEKKPQTQIIPNYFF